MSPEWLWVAFPPLGWFCFAAGGTGPKWVRRYVYPVILAIVLSVFGTAWWKALLTALCTSAVFHLGYGERYTWGQRALVFASYGASLWPLGLVWWTPLVTGTVCTSLMWVSRRGWLTWKAVEGSMGGLHAALAVWLVTAP